MAFRHCEVDDAASAEHAYERAIQREYALFIFAINLPDMSGAMLDRLLARVYPRLHAGCLTAPAILYLMRPEESASFHELQRDARVRGAVPLPLNLDALLNATGTLLSAKSS